MTPTQARALLTAHYGTPYPERLPSFATQHTPRGFFLGAAQDFRRLASRQRSDSGQNERWAAENDELAAACDVLAEAEVLVG